MNKWMIWGVLTHYFRKHPYRKTTDYLWEGCPTQQLHRIKSSTPQVSNLGSNGDSRDEPEKVAKILLKTS